MIKESKVSEFDILPETAATLGSLKAWIAISVNLFGSKFVESQNST